MIFCLTQMWGKGVSKIPMVHEHLGLIATSWVGAIKEYGRYTLGMNEDRARRLSSVALEATACSKPYAY